MNNNNLIDQVVEFCLTHIEHYSKSFSPDAIKLTPGSEFWFTIQPNRIKPGELFPGSAEHRARRIKAWQDAAKKTLDFSTKS